MRTPRQSIWLSSGIGLIAAISGYMVGASQTPVVSVAIPAVFGLVVTGLGFIGSLDIEKKLEPIKEALEKNNLAQVQNTLASINNELKKNPERIGKILVAFSIFYIIGLAFGTYARVTNLYAPQAKRQLPWTQNSDTQNPPTISDAIDWINLQEGLLDLGYSQDQIKNIYTIQVAEWNRQKQSESTTNTSNTNIQGDTQSSESSNQNTDNRNPSRNLSSRLTSPSKPIPSPLGKPPSTERPVVSPAQLPSTSGSGPLPNPAPPPPPVRMPVALPTPKPKPVRLP